LPQAPEALTDEQLGEKLAEILQSWPLYRRLSYKGGLNRRAVPEFLTLDCPSCRKEQFWETHVGKPNAYDRVGEDNRRGFGEKAYKCRNCGNRTVRFYFLWIYENGVGSFEKLGQYPPLAERVPPSLEKALDGQSLEHYRAALRLRNFNYGLGAVSYLRRIVEDRVDDLLDVLAGAAREFGEGAEPLKKLEEVKKSHRFEDKLDLAVALVPRHLRPEGHVNPVGILHELASAGLHKMSEAECIDTFDRCRGVFEYVFERLKPEVETAKVFVEKLKSLGTKQAR
jgi:ribosomal protein S27E